ncbi:hypothetical protein NEAUS03_1172 [Nematocida ausubeli]|nr:hypothetical protein NEAUS03_1172 [Nematocida ausubeli]
MKMISSVVWIKVVALISVLLMNTHRADISLSEIETTLQFEIATDAEPVKINPEGALNFLRGYIYQKMECMYNKRFFAPQIDTKYVLEEEVEKKAHSGLYSYTQKRQNDRAYKALTDSNMDVYNEQYHNHLIELFPSPTGDITIETQGNQSFVQFLRAKKTKEHSLKILAMLLLFSEGVDIPIKVTNTVLKVYETSKEDQIYFDVSMEIPWKNDKTSKEDTLQQKKVRQMISFFKEYATNHEVLSLMVDKFSQEEVATGSFLDSPKFLIQSYIFGFIKDVEHATEFIKTVHTMMEKYAPKTETPSKGDSVYDRLFKPASTETGTDCMALMKETQEILNRYRVFPFADSTLLPVYISVPRYNRKDKTFSSDRLEDYSNCVECMILSLFCCLAYDPNDFTYKTGHMGPVSEELKEFFAPEDKEKKKKSFDTKKAIFQKEWCRVVADLDEPSIAYCKGRNELDCGLINMLLVIAEIVKAPENEKKKILGFAQSLKEQKRLNNELCDDIKEYTKSLFIRLSKTKSPVVEFSGLKIDGYSNGRYDISGTITMSFEQSDIKNTIVLGISKRHSTISMEPAVMKFKDDRIEKMDEIAASCKNETGFVGNLFATYIDYEIRKISSPMNNKDFMRAQMRKTINNSFADINRLLLVKRISDLNYKIDLVAWSILCNMDTDLSPEHSIIRFTSNILGSTELDNQYVQLRMLPLIIFAGLLNKTGSNLNYPNIKLLECHYDAIGSEVTSDIFIEHLLDCDIDVFIRWFKFYIDNFYTQNIISFNPLASPSVNRRICQYIFKDGNMKYSDIIDNLMIEKDTKKGGEATSIIHFIWIVYLCAEEAPNVELIKANLDAIREISYVSEKVIRYIKDASILSQSAIEKLNDMKDQICRNEDDINKFNLFMETLTSITS